MSEDDELKPQLEISRNLKTTVPVLARLATALTCTICYDPFENPVITGCSHTYCSVCIRKYLLFKQQCPQCGTLTTDGQLRTNKSIDESAGLLRDLVSSLESLITQSEKKKPPGDLNSVEIKPDSKPSPERRTEKAKIETFSPLRESQVPSRNSVNSTEHRTKSTCPVCSVLIPTTNLSQHLSTCQNKPVLPKKPVQKLKPLPKLVYALMKDAQLKKTCKEVGLDFKGDRRALIKRHQKYTLLFNSECDQERPRSSREILRQVEREEAAEKIGIGNHSLLQYDRNTDSASIEAKQRQYIKENQSSFISLIETAKLRTGSLAAIESTNKKNKENIDLFTAVDPMDVDEAILDAYSSKPQPKPQPFKSEPRSSKPESEPKPGSSKLELKSESSNPKPGLSGLIEPCSLGTFSSPKLSYLKTDERMSDKETFTMIQNTSFSPKTSFGSPLANPRGSAMSRKKGGNSRKPSRDETKSIKDCLALSVERTQQQDKHPCPVCQSLVSAKYLNIHLDKCLSKSEKPGPSPVLKKTKKPSGKSTKSKPINISIDSDSDLEDLICPWESPPRGRKRNRVVESDDEELPETDSQDWTDSQHATDSQDQDGTDSQNSSLIVAEPSLLDLVNMGLGSKGHSTGFMKASEMMKNKRDENTEKEDEEFSNDFDQYTDHNSQGSYSQDSEDMFASSENTNETKEKMDDSEIIDLDEGSEDESVIIDLEEDNEWDETLNQHIDAATDLLTSDEEKEDESRKVDKKKTKNATKTGTPSETESKKKKNEEEKNEKKSGSRELRKRTRKEEEKTEDSGRKTRKRK